MQPRSRNSIAYVALFAASVAATCLWRVGGASLPADARVAEPAPSPSPPAPALVDPQSPAIAPPDTAAIVDEAAHVRELARESLDETNSWRILQDVAGMTAAVTPESVQALSVLGAANDDPEVRSAALDALRALSARYGDADGSIRAVLRALNSGVDTQIAELGQDLAAELDVPR